MYIKDSKRFNIYASAEIDGVTYPNFADHVLRTSLGITEIPDPTPPDDYSDETYYRTEQDDAPYVVYTKKSEEQLEELAAQKESQRIASLWQAAHDYEYSQVSGSAIGLLAIGVMQQKPKCTAVQNWIKSIWEIYYQRKASTSIDTDFSSAGQIPYTVPELMTELGL